MSSILNLGRCLGPYQPATARFLFILIQQQKTNPCDISFNLFKQASYSGIVAQAQIYAEMATKAHLQLMMLAAAGDYARHHYYLHHP